MRDFQNGGRSAVYSEKAMAATAHPEASLIAVDVMRNGGNAVDAAVAATAFLCVVEPAMTALGSDCFALVSKAAGAPVGINGSGKSASGANAEALRNAGHTTMPLEHGAAVTAPGAVAAWGKLLKDHGTLSFADALEPAYKAAKNGFLVTPRITFDWAENVDKLRNNKGTAKHYLLNGDAPKTGDKMQLPALAETLKTLMNEGPEAFYSGSIAQDIAKTVQEMGGWLTEADLAATTPDDMPPITANYRGQDVVELPPNTQGVIAQLTLKILEGFDLGSLDPFGAKRVHLEMEAARLAYACRDAVIADPDHANGVAEALLSPAFVEKLRSQINPDKAGPTQTSISPFTDTTYLSVVDENRNAVSLINSVFRSFGSGICTEETGILLQNRGGGFSLQEGHPNCLAPSKRPLHTLLPGMVMSGGKLAMSFGVMGGPYQACGHVRLLTNLYDYGMEIQDAIEAPRAFWGGLRASEFSIIGLEKGYKDDVLAELRGMGHQVGRVKEPIGGSQAIQLDHKRGILIAGSDPRKDGCALGY